MRRLLVYILLLLTAVMPLVIPIAALADHPGNIGKTVDNNSHRISPNVITQYTGRTWYDAQQGQQVYEYKARIDAAPSYVDDQPLDTTWHSKSSTKYEAGANLFNARTAGKLTTVTHNGLDMVWMPQVFVGGKEYTCPTAPILLAVDPINKNYHYNTLSWDYGVCERRLRLIEGMISETYVFRTDPGADVQIKSNTITDDGFIGECPVFAYDVEGNNIPISADKVVKAEDLKGAAYPVTIDPTEVYVTSASDGYTDGQGTVYATVQAAATATVTNTSTTMRIGNLLSGSTYIIRRSYVYFDTSAIPDSASITSTNVSLYGSSDWTTTDFSILIQNGMPTYPHDPLAIGDYNKTNYTGIGNTGFNTSGWSTSGWNNISLNTTGISWINLTGVTKFILRSHRDINAEPPPVSASDHQIAFYSYEQGVGYRPYLEVVYSASSAPTTTTTSASYITKSTAYLNGYLDSDGSEACNMSFEYFNEEASNYGFETGDPSTGWTATGTGVKFNRSSLTKYFNTYSANLSRYGTNVSFYQDIGNYSIYKGYQITLSMYVNASVASRAKIGVGDNASTTNSSYHAGDNVWALLSTTKNISANASRVRLSGFVDTGNTSAFYDQAMLCDGATCPVVTTNDSGKTTGTYTTAYLTGLRGNTTYCFRVKAGNSYGTSYGNWSCFTTLAASAEPSNMSAYPAATAVDLVWQKGSGAVNTMVRYKIGGYPSSTTDGSLVYIGTIGGYSHTGLTPGTNYYYRAWSDDGSGVYSANYSSVMTTTWAGSAAVAATPEAPAAPNGWFGSPDYTHMSNFPGYDVINAGADSIQMPRNTAWMLLSILGVVAAGVITFFISKHNLLISVLVSAVFLAMAGTQELISWWYVAIYLIAALSLSYKAITR